jgi:uncharacterized protein YfaT (DUF1175 family)
VGAITLGLSNFVRPGVAGKAANAPLNAATRHESPRSPDLRDTFGDGTPSFLRLDSSADQEAFRRWFVAIAEVQALRPREDIPREVIDCAALLRYSYRNALREHDRPWTQETGIQPREALPSVDKYHYPATPLGASIFRIRAGSFQVDDIKSGAFAEFADAKTLMGLNTHFVSRDIRAARPGDLLFGNYILDSHKPLTLDFYYKEVIHGNTTKTQSATYFTCSRKKGQRARSTAATAQFSLRSR